MIHETPAEIAPSLLDQEIKQLEKLLGGWAVKADVHYGTLLGELTESIAHGYVVQLDQLRRIREFGVTAAHPNGLVVVR